MTGRNCYLTRDNDNFDYLSRFVYNSTRPTNVQTGSIGGWRPKEMGKVISDGQNEGKKGGFSFGEKWGRGRERERDSNILFYFFCFKISQEMLSRSVVHVTALFISYYIIQFVMFAVSSNEFNNLNKNSAFRQWIIINQ